MSGTAPASLSDRAGFLILANIIKFAVGALMPMVMVRLISQADYGTYQQLVLLTTVGVSLLTLGLPTSVFYFYRHMGAARAAGLVVQTSLLLVVGGVLGSAIIWIWAVPIASGMGNPGMAHLLRLGAATLGLLIAGEQSIAFFIAQNRYGQAVMFEVGEALVRVAMLLLPLLLGEGLEGVILYGVAFAALRLVVRWYVLFARSGLDFRGWSQALFLREQLHYSIPIALLALVVLLGTTFNKTILSAYFGPQEFAVFAVGSVVFPLASIFQTSVANVLRAEMPELVRDGNLTEVARVMREATRKLSIIVLPSFIFLFVHAYDFVTVLFTKAYADSVSVFRICVWELPLDMLVLSAIPQVFGKTRVNLYINIAATALMLLASYILVRSFGVYGAAVVATATQWFTVLLFFIVVARLTHSSATALLPLLGIARVLVAALAAATVSRLVGEVTSLGLVNLAIAAGIFTVVFFVVAIPLGVFTADDRALLRRWLGKFSFVKA